MHELEIVDGEAQMAYAKSGGVPWHGLGFPVSDDLTPHEMMKAAKVDWRVRKLATFAEMKVDGKTKRLPTGMKALVREDNGKVLTQVGENWNPVQNEEAFEFFSEFVQNGDMHMDTAGSLKDGQIVWALAKVNESFELFGGDRVESYLLFTNPHQYGKTTNVRFTPIRTVCWNTLTLSLNQRAKHEVSISHRRDFDPDRVKELLGIASMRMGDFKERAQFLGSKRTTHDTLVEYFGHLMGGSKKKDTDLSRNGLIAMKAMDIQPGSQFAPGTWWQAFNAVTFAADHVFGREPNTRLQSAWYGRNNRLKNDALDKALEMAEKA